ncbi:alpha/beta fold hydrolase [Pseudidiomarina mangrovi]|uniref:alpha/beta fold hydrolase n=1 Tax=Pseudidiomarina mangrovi TaxID=2487133 RepID=UPI0032AF21EF
MMGYYTEAKPRVQIFTEYEVVMSQSSSLDLNYEIQGNGPAVVLLHGLFGDLDNLKGLGRELQQDYQVIYVDLRNHGDSAHAEHMDFALMAADLRQLLTKLELPAVHLVGHSLGGKVAMEFALRYPQQSLSVVAADIAPVAYEAKHHHILDALSSLDLSTISSRKEADQALAKTIDSIGVRQFLLKNLRLDEGQFSWRLNLAALQHNYPTLAGAVTDGHYSGPILFIKGGASDYLLAQHEAAIRQRFSRVELKVIEGTGHWLHAEKPQIFNRLVMAFLAQHSRTERLGVV